ncbi:MAG TPA: M67 family metallopeptidase [Solirubrobacteraceae bacterium]|jgi:proteasome lid subunit RPN8/RPN11
MNISAELLAEILAHAKEQPTVEVCGLVAVKPGSSGSPAEAVRVHRAINIHASALKFEIDGKEQLRLRRTIEDEEGCEIGAIYHSHVRSKPYPSQTDINFSALWPGVEWIIVGSAAGEEPEVCSYLIKDSIVEEVPI